MFKKTLILVLVFNLHSELNLATVKSNSCLMKERKLLLSNAFLLSFIYPLN